VTSGQSWTEADQGEQAHRPGFPDTIAIDGPAGAGKSTIGRLLAERLGYIFLDTGAMYRAVSLAAVRQGISPEDGAALADLAETLPIVIEKPAPGETDGRAYTVKIDGDDVTWDVRRPEVEAIVSEVASWPDVRSALVRQQRKMARRWPVVMVGRDITTEVLPDAELKIYLEASLEERARRRHEELIERGREVTYEQVVQEISHRDYVDTHREAGALKKAPDAIVVDSDGLSIEQTLERVMDIVRGWRRSETESFFE
jgi:cytidylate kinase